MLQQDKCSQRDVDMTFEEVQQMVLSFPGVEEYLAFGKRPTFSVNQRLIACIARIDENTLVVKVPDQREREFFLATRPNIYYLTDHYALSEVLLVRIPLADPDELRELLEQAWRTFASKRRQERYAMNG
jgi:hypothetical protein